MKSAKWFWCFLGIYLFLYCGNRLGYVFPNVVQFYLADLLVIPIMATLSLWLMRWLLHDQELLLLSWQLIFMLLACSLIFEVLLPKLMLRYVADPVDVLMYALGAFFFWKVMNKH